MQVLSIIFDFLKVIIIAVTVLGITVVVIYRRLFENRVKDRLRTIVSTKYTSKKDLEKDIKDLYFKYDEEKREKGWK